MSALGHYELLAALLEYPDGDYPARVERARAGLTQHHPEAAAHVAALAQALPESPAELQEIYTRSFDVQPVTTLAVGYLLFGDDYKRGELLTHLRREQLATGVDTGVELPDHLPNVLRLVARWADHQLVAELVREILRPAVARMLVDFGPERMAARDLLYERHFRTLIASAPGRACLFRHALEALAAAVDRDFQGTPAVPPEPGGDFLRSIGRELDLEAGRAS